jgi:hypothetical protein
MPTALPSKLRFDILNPDDLKYRKRGAVPLFLLGAVLKVLIPWGSKPPFHQKKIWFRSLEVLL